MKNGVVDTKTFYYLSGRIPAAIFLAACSAGLCIWAKFIPGTIALILAGLVFTTHYGLEVDTLKKTYFDYLSILWFRIGDHLSFRSIDYVFIKSGRTTKTMNSMISSAKFSDDHYDGYIKFDGHEKVYLLSHDDKTIVMRLLSGLSDKLQVAIMDYSESDET